MNSSRFFAAMIGVGAGLMGHKVGFTGMLGIMLIAFAIKWSCEEVIEKAISKLNSQASLIHLKKPA